MTELTTATVIAEAAWLDRWSAGPTDTGLTLLRDAHLRPTCGCRTTPAGSAICRSSGPPARRWCCSGGTSGVAAAGPVRPGWRPSGPGYRAAGLNPVIIGLGDPDRAAAYRVAQDLRAPVLCDPDATAYRAYGIGHWSV